MEGLYLCIIIDKCHLACIQHGTITYPHGRVADGTRCTADPDDFDVCIEGKCRVQLNIFKCKNRLLLPVTKMKEVQTEEMISQLGMFFKHVEFSGRIERFLSSKNE